MILRRPLHQVCCAIIRRFCGRSREHSRATAPSLSSASLGLGVLAILFAGCGLLWSVDDLDRSPPPSSALDAEADLALQPDLVEEDHVATVDLLEPENAVDVKETSPAPHNTLCAARQAGGEKEWSLVGDAVWADERLVLTPGPATKDNFGAVWCSRVLDLSLDFVLELEMYFGAQDVPGSDGIWLTFVPAEDAQEAGLPYNYFAVGTPAFAVEFDTFANAVDPPNFIVDGWKESQDHVALVAKGSGDHKALGLPWKLVGNLEDAIPRRVRVAWTAGSKTLAVALRKPSEQWSEVLVSQEDLVVKHLGGSREVFYGFTSKCSGGGDYNFQYVVP